MEILPMEQGGRSRQGAVGEAMGLLTRQSSCNGSIGEGIGHQRHKGWS